MILLAIDALYESFSDAVDSRIGRLHVHGKLSDGQELNDDFLLGQGGRLQWISFWLHGKVALSVDAGEA